MNNQHTTNQYRDASNAEDFQPQTKNPQNARSELQPQSNVQSNDGQSILNQENTRIIIPPSNPEANKLPSYSSVKPGINWLMIIIVSFILVVFVEYLFRRRDKKKALK